LHETQSGSRIASTTTTEAMTMKLLKQLMEMEFNDYKPTAEEIEQEIADAKQGIKRAKEQGKAPMVAKYEMKLKQARQKLSSITEATSIYSKMNAADLQKALEILQKAAKTEKGPTVDKIHGDIITVKNLLKTRPA